MSLSDPPVPPDEGEEQTAPNSSPGAAIDTRAPGAQDSLARPLDEVAAGITQAWARKRRLGSVNATCSSMGEIEVLVLTGRRHKVSAASREPRDSTASPHGPGLSRHPLSVATPGLEDRLLALTEQHHGNISAMARELGRARNQVRRWLQHFGIDATFYRKRHAAHKQLERTRTTDPPTERNMSGRAERAPLVAVEILPRSSDALGEPNDNEPEPG